MLLFVLAPNFGMLYLPLFHSHHFLMECLDCLVEDVGYGFLLNPMNRYLPMNRSLALK